MKLIDLKNRILNKSLNDDALIFVNKGSDFLINTYIKQIAKNKNLEIVYSNSLNKDSNLFDFNDNILTVIHVDELTYNITAKNTIIVCNKTTQTTDNVIIFEKLEQWQIEEYAKTMLSGLSTEEVKWLCNICKYDINRISNEINKIAIFDKSERQSIFERLNKESNYSDLCEYNIFNLINAILYKDYKKIGSLLENIENFETTPFGFIALMLKNIKGIMDYKNKQPKETICNYNTIKNIAFKYSDMQLMLMYSKISSLDYLIKSGNLPVDLTFDYIITHIL